MRLALAAALALPLLSAALPAAGALTAYVSIRVNGSDLQCETTNPGFQNHAEAIAVATNVIRPISGGIPGGNRQHSPIRITKLLDKCTPLLAAALVSNQEVDAVIKFVRTDPADGTVQHYFTIEITRGRVVGQSLVLPDTLDPATSDLPALEHLSFTFLTITWRDVANGTEATDNLQQAP